ncbi:MAG: Na/Pi cotransporter family protein [Bacteroidales bacterium]|nr:Na/Pi cotransporter family protein [Bacteroidales bacterium]
MLLQFFTLLGALGMFLYGMNLMSSGLQKAAGNRLRHFLSAMTSNRFTSVLTGLTITAIIQSSSATTVMVVGFVNAGLLALGQAIGVIMGANIGTTVTAWLISLLGFKMDISILAVPLMAVGFVLSIAKREQHKHIGECIVGFSLLFLGLSLMKNSVPDLSQNPEILSFITRWTGFGFGSILIFLVIGTLLTLVLQSSSATMALTLIMMSMGWIPFEMAAAMVLGENIGTTITANIAAAVANVNAKRAALAHTFFNLFGVIWALCLYRPFLSLIGLIISEMGYPNPVETNYTAGLDPTAPEATAALYGIAMLHTLFNTINTFILIWFVPQIEKIVTAIIKSKNSAEDEIFKLQFIQAGPMVTAELAISQAQNEIVHFAQISRKGLSYVKAAVQATTSGDFDTYCGKLVKYEEIADRIEYEIATFLRAIPEGSISEHTRQRITAMYKIIGELESLGDSGEAVSRILSRRNAQQQSFSPQYIANIESMIALVDKAYEVMIANLEHTGDLQTAIDSEIAINNLRNTLRDEAVANTAVAYQNSAYYMDVVSELERMGDYIINVSEAVHGKK